MELPIKSTYVSSCEIDHFHKVAYCRVIADIGMRKCARNAAGNSHSYCSRECRKMLPKVFRHVMRQKPLMQGSSKPTEICGVTEFYPQKR